MSTSKIPSSGANLSKAHRIYRISNSMKKNEKITYELLMAKYYFAAIPFAVKHLENKGKVTENFEKALRLIVLKTGTESFMNIKSKTLRDAKSNTLNFVLGLKYFERKNYKASAYFLGLIPEEHRFGPEARMMGGSSLSMAKKFDAAATQYKRCYNVANSAETKAKNNKVARYYAIIKESCLIHAARLKFTNRKFKESIDAYEEVAKKSYMWPYILLEKAWSNYHMEDYNRTLGLLVTYKYPLLKSYFLPEAEVLTALAYLKLCLWDDALEVVKQYYSIYKPRSERLKAILLKYKSSNTYFLELTKKNIRDSEKQNPFIRNLVTQVRKTIKYNLDFSSFKLAKNEIKRLNKAGKSSFTKMLVSKVQNIIKQRKKSLNWFIKKRMFDFINKIHRNSYEMFKIKIEIMSQKRSLLYKNTKLVSDRGRGSFENVNRKSDQHFWEFKGSFWADELGEYSFGLKSNCAEIKRGRKQ